MNNIQIENILKKDKFSKHNFIGVYSRDNLPLKVIKPSTLIFNSDISSGPGEHWIALNYTKNGNCEFFDSLGLGPHFYGIENYLKNTSKKCKINKNAIQSLNSTYCGFYSILFILIRSRNYSYKTFLNSFEKNTNKNDIYLKKMMKKFD
jgi:hypothetical protein